MSVRCPQCGTETSTDSSFCPQCGSRVTPAAPPPPMPVAPPPPGPASYQPPQSYPPVPQQPWAHPGVAPMAPVRKSGGGWVKWVVGIVGVLLLLLVGLIALAALGEDEEPASTPAASTPANPPASNTPSTPTPPKSEPAPAPAPAPANTAAGFKLTLAGKGALQGGVKGEYYAVYGKYLAAATGNKATFYMFQDGKAIAVGQVDDKEAGNLLSVTVGDMLNAGTPVMVVVYEQKVYVAPPMGQPQVINSQTTDNVQIGDFDGDGKQESIFLGQGYFNVFRYMQGSDTKPIYRKDGIAKEHPVLYATRQKAGDRELLMGHAWEGDKLSIVLYKWDGVGGAVPIGSYPVSDAGTASWVASGPSALGATFALSRKTAPSATIELFQIASDAKSMTSLGSVKFEGQGAPAVAIGEITTPGKPQLLAIDESGNWFLYTIAPK